MKNLSSKIASLDLKKQQMQQQLQQLAAEVGTNQRAMQQNQVQQGQMLQGQVRGGGQDQLDQLHMQMQQLDRESNPVPGAGQGLGAAGQNFGRVGLNSQNRDGNLLPKADAPGFANVDSNQIPVNLPGMNNLQMAGNALRFNPEVAGGNPFLLGQNVGGLPGGNVNSKLNTVKKSAVGSRDALPNIPPPKAPPIYYPKGQNDKRRGGANLPFPDNLNKADKAALQAAVKNKLAALRANANHAVEGKQPLPKPPVGGRRMLSVSDDEFSSEHRQSRRLLTEKEIPGKSHGYFVT